jgi:hypothetical protein
MKMPVAIFASVNMIAQDSTIVPTERGSFANTSMIVAIGVFPQITVRTRTGLDPNVM